MKKDSKFTDCKEEKQVIEQYKSQSDSVKMFVDENNYQNSPTDYRPIKELYTEYRGYCIEDGFKPVNKSNFIKRLKVFGVLVDRLNLGNVAYLSKRNFQYNTKKNEPSLELKIKECSYFLKKHGYKVYKQIIEYKEI